MRSKLLTSNITILTFRKDLKQKNYRQGRALDFSDNYIFLAVIAKTESLTSAITLSVFFRFGAFGAKTTCPANG